ncbi:unnamed protein product, partial [Schistosoma curassoni]|uniref:ABC transporter domain-containing protein n=1 Tax=Schistosoma curassoni TaxID=6186 RepID=A0A183L721_9TREM
SSFDSTLRCVVFFFLKNLKQITLNSINFKACGRELIGIIGSVGSGKVSV